MVALTSIMYCLSFPPHYRKSELDAHTSIFGMVLSLFIYAYVSFLTNINSRSDVSFPSWKNHIVFFLV